MAKRGKNVAKKLSDFTDELNKLSSSFGKFTDDEAKLFDKVKQGLADNQSDLKKFITDMSNARIQNARTYKAENPIKPKTTFYERKQNRIRELAKKHQEKQSRILYNAQAPKPKKGPDYSRAAGRKDVINDNRNHQNSNGVSNTDGNIIPYVDAQTQRRSMVDEMAKSNLRNKKLEDANKTPLDRLKDAVNDKIASSSFNENTTRNRQAYNDYIHSQGRDDYIRTNKEFVNMQKGVGIHGTFGGTSEGMDSLQRMKGIQDAEEAAILREEQMRISKENAESWAGFKSGIGEWVHKNQTITAGIIAGSAYVLGQALDDD